MWLMLIGGLLVVVSAVMASMGFRGREQIVGIDLGTTFSVVAIKSGGEVRLVPDYLHGGALLPSIVTFHPNGSTIVGRDAAAYRDSLPQNTIFNAKRFIGKFFHEVLQDVGVHPFSVVGDPSVAPDATESALAGFALPRRAEAKGGSWVTPIEVGAAVVSHLKRSVSKHLGFDISRAVICVPAKFSSQERRATQWAFEKAGFKVMRVLEEPVAAAVAYNLHKDSGSRHVVVYDIGGGTLDTSLLYLSRQSVSVLGVSGDDHLGGADFDIRLRELLASKARHPVSESSNENSSEQKPSCEISGFHILSEQAKIALSSASFTTVQCAAQDGRIYEVSVTRDEFEQVAKDLFERCIAPVKRLLEDQMMESMDVDDIVLVGGASRTPKIRQLLQGFFGSDKLLHTEIDPDVTVAIGAANIID